ncbi:unnamed protein product [Fraxinus pennsylvanica]|uniref:APO domain-containing protein n=1 Tax=Fraxinus pennsylvanica TaxID=56036 RepID=A0AAD2AG62_9LAMI|nr:unnamed protein product [Fraxinus pennsylvanica]
MTDLKIISFLGFSLREYAEFHSERRISPTFDLLKCNTQQGLISLDSLKVQKRRGVPSPKRGLVVQRLIPVAYRPFDARVNLINNLKKLLKVVLHHAFGVMKFMLELLGILSSLVEDQALQFVKDFMSGGMQLLKTIAAVMELFIQAGVNLPEYPTKRRRKPIIRIGKSEFINADERELPDPDPDAPKPSILAEIPDTEILLPSKEETAFLPREHFKHGKK